MSTSLQLTRSAPLAKVRAAVPEHLQPQTQARYGVIAPVIEAQNSGELPRGFRTETALIEHQARTAPECSAGKVPKDKPWAGVSARCVRLWITRFRTGGFAALADPPRSDQGVPRSLCEASRLVVKYVYLNQGLSMQQAYRAALREAERLGHPPATYDAVRRFLRSQPTVLSIFTREGEKAFNDKCAPYIQRQPPPVMHTWISDHMKHDVWVFNDLWDDRRGEAVRPVFTALLDFGSRKTVGYAWCLEPSSHSISSALRMGIASFGAPRELYIDNGKDYQKIGRIGLSPEASGVCARLGIKPRYCLPRHPQAKPIERFFGTLHLKFDALWKPYYCGRSPLARPEDCSAVLKQHELYRKGKLPASPLPLASEFVRLAAAWVAEYNSTHSHSGRGMHGQTPDQVFDAAWPPEKRQPIDPRALDPLLWDRTRRLLSEGGCAQLGGARYEPADPASFAAIFPHIGEDVLIARDPYNLCEAVALDAEGRFLGVLRAQALLEQGPTSHDQVRASMRLRRQARRAVADYVQHVSAACREMGVPKELEALRQRAGLAATGTDGIAAAAPGARPQLPQRSSYVPEDSPFVDDAAKRFIESMKEIEGES